MGIHDLRVLCPASYSSYCSLHQPVIITGFRMVLPTRGIVFIIRVPSGRQTIDVQIADHPRRRGLPFVLVLLCTPVLSPTQPPATGDTAWVKGPPMERSQLSRCPSAMGPESEALLTGTLHP